MCGESMRIETREQVDRLPGSHTVRTRVLREWVCPECDYFEEADDDEEA